MPFSGQLKVQANKIWREIYAHPFLDELYAGTLPMDRFTYFILQDYLYLLDFAQVLCLGGAKSLSMSGTTKLTPISVRSPFCSRR